MEIRNQDDCTTADSAHLLLSCSHAEEVAGLEVCAKKIQHDEGGATRGKRRI